MRSKTLALTAVLAATAIGCDVKAPSAYGEANSIIVAVPDSLWTEVRDTMHTVMEPQIFTVRNERTFELTQISPLDPDWVRLQEWKQVLVIGRADDPWVAPVVKGQEAAISELPALVEKEDIWARGQVVTALVLPAESMVERIVEILPRLHEHFDQRFRERALKRMFVSGANVALQDTLRREAGFSLLLPEVYDWARLDASTYRFLNANRNQGALDRSILVTWRDGAKAPTPEQLVAWRDSLGAGVYEWGVRTDTTQLFSAPLEGFGEGSLELQGVWLGTDPTFPMAGPFLTRVVVCPAQDRTYLLDAWLYAPSRNKYEYMLQLETILDSFECAA